MAQTTQQLEDEIHKRDVVIQDLLNRVGALEREKPPGPGSQAVASAPRRQAIKPGAPSSGAPFATAAAPASPNRAPLILATPAAPGYRHIAKCDHVARRA